MDNTPEFEAVRQLFRAAKYEARFAMVVLKAENKKGYREWLISACYCPDYFPSFIHVYINQSIRIGFALGAGIWP